jgi:hypothetical protein
MFVKAKQSKGRAPFQLKTEDLLLKDNILNDPSDLQRRHPMDPVKWSVQGAPRGIL